MAKADVTKDAKMTTRYILMEKKLGEGPTQGLNTHLGFIYDQVHTQLYRCFFNHSVMLPTLSTDETWLSRTHAFVCARSQPEALKAYSQPSIIRTPYEMGEVDMKTPQM